MRSAPALLPRALLTVGTSWHRCWQGGIARSCVREQLQAAFSAASGRLESRADVEESESGGCVVGTAGEVWWGNRQLRGRGGAGSGRWMSSRDRSSLDRTGLEALLSTIPPARREGKRVT
ncbi:hypothetical protein FRC11_014743 [Ceratobasidium sp. 423]|nr:hypothetical protein FRC11_014743 [Ceratobasidium sp. 423]